MESALLITITTSSLFPISETLNPRFSNPLPTSLSRRRLSSNPFASVSLRRFSAATPPLRCRMDSAPFALGGGGAGSGNVRESGGGGGGGEGGADGGEAESKPAAVDSEEIPALSSDAIILDVEGMACGGCADKVKKILENQPQVSSAHVNLTKKKVIVWPLSEAKVAPNWQQQLGEALAKHLTNCGFESSLRDDSEPGLTVNIEGRHSRFQKQVLDDFFRGCSSGVQHSGGEFLFASALENPFPMRCYITRSLTLTLVSVGKLLKTIFSLIQRM